MFAYIKHLETYYIRNENIHYKEIYLSFRRYLIIILSENFRNALPEPSPVDVIVEITIQDISDISVITGTFVIDFWISAIWLDSRLSFSQVDPCRRNLSLDHDMEPKLWFVFIL